MKLNVDGSDATHLHQGNALCCYTVKSHALSMTRIIRQQVRTGDWAVVNANFPL